jgi:hypothetical protein
MSTLTDTDVRAVTDAEVHAFQEQGWVSLPGLVSRELAGTLLARLKPRTGVDHDELPPDHPDADAVAQRLREKGIADFVSFPRLGDSTVWEFASSRALGEASARLTGHRPMRLFSDAVICKLPAWIEERDLAKTGTAAAQVYGGETPWHQDFPGLPWDRAGGVQFWLALCEITPEMGSLQHLTGSHREPPLGGVQYATDQTLKTLHPELWEKYTPSPAHHFQPGDVLAHTPLTVHYAQANRTDRLRWVYTSYRIPAETLNNGMPQSRFTAFDFKPWKPFDHPKFPIVAD